MTGSAEQMEIQERLKLIETMMAEGRRTTESWGWTFLLWGVAYYVAIAWSTLGHSRIAWPVTMLTAAAVMSLPLARRQRSQPETTMGRAIGSVWIAVGIALFMILLSLGMSGRFDFHVFVGIVGALLGAANAASGLILRWKMQMACAMVWWGAAVAACFGSENTTLVAFLTAIFFCQIVFGIYGMVRASHKNEQDAAHA